MSLVHLHLLLNHIPVIGSLFAVLLFAVVLVRREMVSTKFALGFTVAVSIAAAAVYFTGGAAEDAVEKLAGVTEAAIDRHEEAAELATVAFGILGVLALFALVAFRSKAPPRWVALAGFVGALAVSALMAWTANLGGLIRHTEIQGSTAQQIGRDVDD